MGDGLDALADLLTPMAVRVVATLRVADHLPGTAAAAAAAVGADPDVLDRILHHLAAAGVLTVDGSGRFGLTARAEALRSDHPGRLRERLDIDGPLGRADLAFVELLHTARTGAAAFPARYGRDFWSDLASDPARSAAYDAAMGADVAAWVPVILGAFDWGSLGSVVDVGGGDGTLLAALLRAHPHLRGTVVEQPGPAAAARGTLGDRADVVVGSFFDRLPGGAGGYLLTAVVHDWDDEAAVAILRRCTEAGRTFVIEKIGADGRRPSTTMDLRLLAYMGGRERTVEALGALAERAGSHVVAVHPAGAIVVLELSPAASAR